MLQQQLRQLCVSPLRRQVQRRPTHRVQRAHVRGGGQQLTRHLPGVGGGGRGGRGGLGGSRASACKNLLGFDLEVQPRNGGKGSIGSSGKPPALVVFLVGKSGQWGGGGTSIRLHKNQRAQGTLKPRHMNAGLSRYKELAK